MRPAEVIGNSLVPVAQYLRASTEHQQFSTANQGEAIAEYAAEHNFQVVQTYTDEARSGLVLKHRPGLQQLLRDVVAGDFSYKAVLVYDVSRWGRFLDADESAHYEFLCKTAGVPVHYCAEIFGNDSSLPNLILKAIKRSMAGEYSRELSLRVHRGIERIVRRGYRPGALPGYGLRRLLVSGDGEIKQQLERNQRKSISTDRVVFCLGPSNEVQCVRDIYRMYINEQMSHSAIARTLNERRIPANEPGGWSHYVVRGILTNAKYTGSMVYNRTSQYLKTRQKRLPQSEWIVVPNAFEPIVDAETFRKASEIRYSKAWYQSDDQLLERLRTILKEEGKLSIRILAERLGAPTPAVCRLRFGSLANTYKLLNYESERKRAMDLRTRLYVLRKSLMDRLVSMFPGELKVILPGLRFRTILRHKSGLKISVRTCRHMWPPAKPQHWVVEHHSKENDSITLLALLDRNNTELDKLILLPRLTFDRKVAVGLKDAALKPGMPMSDFSQFISLLDGMRIQRRTKLLS